MFELMTTETNAANQIGINLKLTISESQLTLEVNVIKTIGSKLNIQHTYACAMRLQERP